MRRVIVFVFLSLALLSENARAQVPAARTQEMRLNLLEDQARRARYPRFSSSEVSDAVHTGVVAEAIEKLVKEQNRANALADDFVKEQRRSNVLTAKLIEEQKRANDLRERELLAAQAQAKAEAADLAKKQAELDNPIPVVAPAIQVDPSATLIQEQRQANALKEQELHELTMFLGITAFAVVAFAVAIGGAVSFQIRKSRSPIAIPS